MGGVAVLGLVLGCGWTVGNVLRADVYPTLGTANYDAPIVRQSWSSAVYQPKPVGHNVLADAGVAQSQPFEMVASSSSLSFSERFAAAAPRGVEPKPQPELPKLAESPRPQGEAPKLAAAPRAKEAASTPVQVASLSATPRQIESRPATSAGATVRDMAQRAKNAVMSLGLGDRQRMVEKLWGKQQSSGLLLAFASADASVTGSVEDGPRQNQNPALGGSAPYDRATAVYDISARTVYLPDGTKLEAHSGLGSKLDDPRSANVKMHGVTPPHIYELKPRETLFHGVPALRLTPIGGEEAIFGRSGLLAHTFMLGPNGDFNGCVSFRDYDAFLNAYHNQGIRRLAVVAKVD